MLHSDEIVSTLIVIPDITLFLGCLRFQTWGTKWMWSQQQQQQLDHHTADKTRFDFIWFVLTNKNRQCLYQSIVGCIVLLKMEEWKMANHWGTELKKVVFRIPLKAAKMHSTDNILWPITGVCYMRVAVKLIICIQVPHFLGVTFPSPAFQSRILWSCIFHHYIFSPAFSSPAFSVPHFLVLHFPTADFWFCIFRFCIFSPTVASAAFLVTQTCHHGPHILQFCIFQSHIFSAPDVLCLHSLSLCYWCSCNVSQLLSPHCLSPCELIARWLHILSTDDDQHYDSRSVLGSINK